MSLADLLQTVSLGAVAITIGLSAIQNRHAAAQSREAAQQSKLAQSDVKQAAHQNTVGHSASFLASLATSETDLLAWFLQSRGIPPASVKTNLRYMLMYLRMEVHETTYLAHLDGALPGDVWGGWERVIALDAATSEFRAIWPIVSDSYAARFGEYIDSVISRTGPLPGRS